MICHLRIEMITWASFGSCFDWLVVFVFSLLCSPPWIGRNDAIYNNFFQNNFFLCDVSEINFEFEIGVLISKFAMYLGDVIGDVISFNSI